MSGFIFYDVAEAQATFINMLTSVIKISVWISELCVHHICLVMYKQQHNFSQFSLLCIDKKNH